MAIRYWLLVHPLDRARELVESGTARVAWGGAEPIADFREADGVVIYAPREHNPDGEPLRAAVAAGRVTADGYQLGGHGAPRWVAPVDWLRGARIAPIRPLRDMLELTRDSKFWGERLRPGWLELTHRDFIIFEDAVRPAAPEPSGFALDALREAASPPPSPAPGADARERAERAWREWGG
ncbi:EVE domain-containing protein [Gulosibacter faecalis]|uniref:EVE domain-containing protein n=1 Tax=Gulosibacter faecalis TaxID=272240 RepID=A0ABW5UU90_9MICO|nr:hypothetical protein [Gulosibacter faecalis]